MRVAIGLAVILALAACVGPGGGARGRGGGVATGESHRQCFADLRTAGVRFEALPDRQFGGGCSAMQSVKLVDIGTPVTNLGAMRCPLARAFTGWTRDVAALAEEELGARVRRIESWGTYACRPVNNVPGNRLSEHGRANAVDIAAFVLADGRRISVKAGWTGPDEATRRFLRAAHRAGCRRFAIVLGPDANAAHADHLHFDMGRGPYCR